MKLAKDILGQVVREFGAKATEATDLLRAVPSSLPEHSRSVRCIVFLAQGDVRLLPLLIDQALCDYRDVIFWAEYRGWQSAQPRRIRDFSRPFGEQALSATGSSEDKPRLPPDVQTHFKRLLRK